MTTEHQTVKDQVLRHYHKMVLIREFEGESYRQYMQKNIRGFLHAYSGQEAVGVGIIGELEAQDYVISSYRDHGHAIAKGSDVKRVMAELFGKSTGTSRGKGGSMHLFDVEKRFMGGHAIVAGQIPIAVGLALATKEIDKQAIVVCFLGDGAMQEGEFHESMNLASIWKLPLLFVIENNLYGMGADVARTFAIHDEIYKIANGYKMASAKVDGMELFEVRDAGRKAIGLVRSGEGPYLLEAQTYRFRGHSISDPANYRPEIEVSYWMSRDPIGLLQARLIKEDIVTQEELDEIHKVVENEIVEAVNFAEKSPFPNADELYTNVVLGSGG